MSFPYTCDATGKPVGVFIPINEWEQLTIELEKVRTGTKNSKSAILKSSAKGLNQVE